MCSGYPEFLNHAPPEDWTISSAVMEEYTGNTQLELSGCIFLVNGEIEQKYTKRRGSFQNSHDEPSLAPLNSLLHEAVDS